MTIKTYPKSELAMLYFPESSNYHIATNRLRSWINKCPELVAALRHTHQSLHSKSFSPRAVRLIVKYLGEP